MEDEEKRAVYLGGLRIWFYREESGKPKGRVERVLGEEAGVVGVVWCGMRLLNWVCRLWNSKLWLCDLTSPTFHVMAVVIQNSELFDLPIDARCRPLPTF